ncbi:PREDICTED: LOC109949315 [Prunus dulcis]|uniref:PREDICTED: LOC109949315 n=1 Tax=Prunus dulcis TaxID=3755 RepID=A0A5E4G8C0_PRUDU|nr:PREDICTED: LOC109949315 [Prunus dulcis]
MSISILDVAVIFGFHPHGWSADWLRDFQEDPSKEKDRKKNFKVLSGLIGSNRTYRALMGAFKDQKIHYPYGEHMMFLMYWLNRFIFPSTSNCITMMVAPDAVPLRDLILSSISGPKGVDDPMASENMDIFSCLQSRDLPCGGRTDSRNYQYGVEAYLQFFSRQLGCPQVFPKLNYPLINKGSSYRFPRLSREDLLGIRAKYADSTQALELKPYQPDCCCTQSFQSWWNHYHGRFGAIDIVYKRAFKGCLFRQELSKKNK